jgi:hypothetical protein
MPKIRAFKLQSVYFIRDYAIHKIGCTLWRYRLGIVLFNADITVI